MFLKANTEPVVYSGSDIATYFPPTQNSCAGLTADMIGSYSLKENGDNYIVKLSINSTEAAPDTGNKSRHLVNIIAAEDVEEAAAGYVGFSGLRNEYIDPEITATINKTTGRMVSLHTVSPSYMKFDSAKVMSIINVQNVGVGIRCETKWTVQW